MIHPKPQEHVVHRPPAKKQVTARASHENEQGNHTIDGYLILGRICCTSLHVHSKKMVMALT